MRRIIPPVFVALCLRILGAWFAADLPCHADECSYRELAAALGAGQGILPSRGHLWPPGYTAFLAAHEAFSRDPLVLARYTQALLAAVTIVPVASMARLAFGEAVMVASAWLLALSPTLVAFSHYLWPETLFLFLFASACALSLELRRRAAASAPFGGVAAAAGGALGLACLVKSLPMYFPLILLPWLVASAADRRRSASAAVLVGLAFVVTLLPWSSYASVRYERFVLLEATAGLNLRRGNGALPPFNADWRMERPAAAGEAGCDRPNPIDRDRCDARAAITFVAEHPGTFLARIPTKMADLWTPTSFLVRHLRLGLYGELPRWVTETIVGLDVAWWLLVALGGAAGFTLAIREDRTSARDFRTVALVVLGYVIAVQIATFGMSRFRIPLYPFFAVFAARALVERHRLAELARSPWRAAILAATVVLLVAMWLSRWSSIRPLA